MKVALGKIGESELELEENIAAKEWDLDSEEIHFLGNINIHCFFSRFSGQIKVRVFLKIRRDIRCSRCLEWNEIESEKSFDLIYEEGNIKGGFLEVNPEIRERILLDWPLKPLCRPDCKGLCPYCGRNLNYEQCLCQNKKEEKNNNFGWQKLFVL